MWELCRTGLISPAVFPVVGTDGAAAVPDASIVYIIVYFIYIIGIVETWANDEIRESELKIDGYEMYRVDRREGREEVWSYT